MDDDVVGFGRLCFSSAVFVRDTLANLKRPNVNYQQSNPIGTTHSAFKMILDMINPKSDKTET